MTLVEKNGPALWRHDVDITCNNAPMTYFITDQVL